MQNSTQSTQTRLFNYERINENSQKNSNEETVVTKQLDNILSEICSKVYYILLRRKRNKPDTTLKVQAEFYPYTNIKLTSRNRGNKLLIRFSDILSEAPSEVLTGAAFFIISQQLNLKCPSEQRKIYRDYIYSHKIRSDKKRMRQKRALKRIKGTVGSVHDLDNIFEIVNQSYFDGECNKPAITWSVGSSRSRLGHFDPDLNTLVITDRLDNMKTPKYVLEYVMYHELLHAKHPGRYIEGRWCVHTREFKDSERRFEFYKEAKDWINKNRI